MGLERQHIFEDILGDGSRVYHSAILTCYSFDPTFYSNFYKPELNARGIRNQIVLVDADRLDEATESERISSFSDTTPFSGFTPLRTICPAGGVFHPKIGLFIGAKRVTAVVGSGNLTYSGMSFNDEAWCAFSASTDELPEAAVIASIWSYLRSVIARQPMETAEMQLAWMVENSELLQRIISRTYPEPSTFSDNGEMFRFAANSDKGTILQGIIASVGREKVRKITVCAPFFDHDGVAILDLLNEFSPESVECLVKEKVGSLPVGLPLEAHPAVRFFLLTGKGFGPMVHAKLIQIETDNRTVLAAGSANASIQALGHDGRYANDEADILICCNHRRDYIRELGIERGDAVSDLTDLGDSSEKDSVRRVKRDVTILGCELLEDGYHLILDKAINDVDVAFESASRKKETVRQASLTAQSVIPQSDTIYKMVSVEKNGVRISNLCNVIIKSETEKSNPNREFGPISPLIDNARNPEDFEELLKYVHIEEEGWKKSPSHSKSHGDGDRKEAESGPITDEDLEKRVYRQRISTIQKVNDRILDRIFYVLTSPQEDIPDYREHPEDEEQKPEDIDKGRIDKGPSSRKESSPERVFTEMDGARKFFKRLVERYDDLTWKSESYDETGFLIRKPYYIQRKTDISLSAICIAVYKMCMVAKSGTRKEWNEMMEAFVRIVGAYLLIYRDPPSDMKPGSPSYIKIARKHQNLVVFSLLLIAFWDGYGERQHLPRLLALNLFDTYRNDPSLLDGVMQEFEELRKRKLIPSRDRNVDMIWESLAAYRLFIQNKEAKKERLSSSMEHAIIYRPSFGFVLLKDIVMKPVISKQFPVFCTAIAPGFRTNRILNTSLREVVTCYEQK